MKELEKKLRKAHNGLAFMELVYKARKQVESFIRFTRPLCELYAQEKIYTSNLTPDEISACEKEIKNERKRAWSTFCEMICTLSELAYLARIQC